MKEPVIYLDGAATTPLDPEVLEVMLPFLGERFANPSATHAWGREVRRAVEDARERTAEILDADPAGVTFTSGATESNNLAIRGLAPRLRGRRVAISRLEHASVSEPAALLAGEGWSVERIGNDHRGRLDLQHLEEVLKGEPCALVAICRGSNEIGTVQDLRAAGRLIRAVSPETWLHVDAAQTAGYLPWRPREWHIDSVAVSAHKMHGPKGMGILARYREPRPVPLLAGGGQERGLRSGTENAAAIVGGVEALARAAARRGERADAVAALRDRLRERLAAAIEGVAFNGDPESCLPHILSAAFEGLLGEVLVNHLEREGVFLSAGSACHAGRGAVSPALTAVGLSEPQARGTVRFSMTCRNEPAEIDRAAEETARQAAWLREVGIA